MKWMEKYLNEIGVEDVETALETFKKDYFPENAVPKDDYNKKADKVDELEGELNTAKTTLEETNDTLEELKTKAENADDYKTQLDEITNKYDEYKEQEEQRIVKIKKKSAVKDLLHEAKADPKLSKLLVNEVDLESVELSDDGGVKNRDDIINPLKEEYKTAFGESNFNGDEPVDGQTGDANPYRAKYKQAMENGNRREAIKIKQKAYKEGQPI